MRLLVVQLLKKELFRGAEHILIISTATMDGTPSEVHDTHCGKSIGLFHDHIVEDLNEIDDGAIPKFLIAFVSMGKDDIVAGAIAQDKFYLEKSPWIGAFYLFDVHHICLKIVVGIHQACIPAHV